MDEKMLNKQEVADHFVVSMRTVERWVKRGLLVKVVIGRVTRFRPADVESLVAQGMAASHKGGRQ